ncbi:HNH endonuclease signature motif containing protein [Intrasporangium flavum]|uniref:HNH endonuclease signature motif containing protein n=1 Tax=Intrasporangium flavum TaxID=1428657 RepID=UPI00096E0454|nr:HNH endonuclease signature motif containing protein [Intrasporangium flavum]
MLLDTRPADAGTVSTPSAPTRSVRARAAVEGARARRGSGRALGAGAIGEAGQEQDGTGVPATGATEETDLSEATDTTGSKGSTGATDATDLSERLAVMLEAVRGLANDFPFWSLGDEAVALSFGHAQALREAAQALSVMLAREADERGLAGAARLSGPDWLRVAVGAGNGDRSEPGPGEGAAAAGSVVALEGGDAATMALLGSALREPRWELLAARVAACEVSAVQAGVIVRFQRDLAPIADREHLDDVVASLVEHAPALTVRELRRLVGHARASLRPPAEAEIRERGLRAGRSLRRVGSCAGFVDFLLRLDPEGAAILEAAIDPLARPRPDLDWSGLQAATTSDTTPGPGASASGAGDGGAASGALDPRTPATRRADALLELVGRAVGAPEGVARTPRTTLVVTMSLEALLEQVQGAGIAEDDAVLSPGAVRRLACEAGIVPMVLGGPSEVLDVGRAQRFFTPAQRRALARRDGGCSYPGCTIPPQWCEAHHVVHWLHGGLTDLANGALLCGRHHTVVHERGLTATVNALGVTWHR